MIEEAYVSFEVAKLLKEKGFDELTAREYNKNGDLLSNRTCGYDGEKNICIRHHGLFPYPAPTQQMAMRWLREVHTMGITIGAANTYNEGVGYYWHITDNHPGVKWLSGPTYCKTYEEAAEEAIKYCLGNLIKND